MTWFGRGDESEPYDESEDVLADRSDKFGFFRDDDDDDAYDSEDIMGRARRDAGFCAGNHDEDTPCFGNSPREAFRSRIWLFGLQVFCLAVAALGVWLMWTALWGTLLGTEIALLLTALFFSMWKAFHARVIESFFWGREGFDTSLFVLYETEEI